MLLQAWQFACLRLLVIHVELQPMNKIVKHFPVLVVISALAGMFVPEWFTDLNSLVVPLLMAVMLGMGLTLKPRDFYDLREYRFAAAAGVALQFTVMPLLALSIASIFQLNRDLTTGLVLVGSVAGGTASNVITLLARGNVALSVSMTSISTLVSVLITPLLMTWLVGSTVTVPAIAMIGSLFEIILLPVSIGVALNVFAENWVKRISPVLPAFSVMVVALIIAIVVALNAESAGIVAPWIFAATLLHNVLGMVIGYFAAAFLGLDRVICRTVAIEVGMQNSGLAATLALKFFGISAALPGAIFSIWQNITGSLFASACVGWDERKAKTVNQD